MGDLGSLPSLIWRDLKNMVQKFTSAKQIFSLATTVAS